MGEAVGTRIRGSLDARYVIVGPLGRGGMGEVVLARDTHLNRTVAVKIMDPKLSRDPALVRRFQTEVQVTAQLDHPSIVPVYSMEGATNGSLAYSMPVVRGRTLRNVLDDTRDAHAKARRPRGASGLPSRLLLFVQLCNAVHYAHRRGVIHRDLKPANVIVGPFGEVVLVDWGVARLVGAHEEHLSRVSVANSEETTVGEAVGSPQYMSPEQARGQNRDLDGRSDQYTLGLILFELVTLSKANPGTTPADCVDCAARGVRRPIVHAFGERIPRELSGIIDKATRAELGDRYPDVGALAEDVMRFLRDEEVDAAPDRLPHKVTRWIGHNRRTVVAGMAGVVALALVAVSTLVTGAALAMAQLSHEADVRQRELARAVSIVARQAHAIDAEFLRLAGLVEALSSSAEDALQEEPATTQEVFLVEDTQAGHWPPDIGPSKVYGSPTSFDWPDIAMQPALNRRQAERELGQLISLTPALQSVLLRSDSGKLVLASREEQRRRVLDEGVPVVYSYVATEDGILVAAPGTWIYPERYDPREWPWYTETVADSEFHWGTSNDESGLGWIVNATRGIFDTAGKLIGVAGLSISASYVADRMLAPEGLRAPVEAYLVMADGTAVAQSSQRGISQKGRTPGHFPHDEVVRAFAAGQRSGELRTGSKAGERLILWDEIAATGWMYVVEGDAEALVFGG